MVFTSYSFLFLFLPAVLLVYYAVVRRRNIRLVVLLLASYLFYAWPDWRFLGLILFSTVLDLFCAGLMTEGASPRRRKLLLLVSLAGNLGLLGWFKYRNFFVESLNGLLAPLGMDALSPIRPDILLPIGISFYTFQSMSYTIDVYRGQAKPLPWRQAHGFLTYVALFPQLVAGPIVRFKELADQLFEREHSWDKITQGLFLFMLGFVKKTLLANDLAYFPRALFGGQHAGFLDAWTGLTSYTLQIYFDFSGYSDMAIGLGLLFGFTFPINFNSPYKSESITDFWRRWHISLSSWLRDYLYIPLGGNRGGALKTARNLLLTMLLGGLWHGAAWTYVLWGAWHGLWLGFERWIGKRSPLFFLPRVTRRALTFLVVTLGWLLFEARSLDQVRTLGQSLLAWNDGEPFLLGTPRDPSLGLYALILGLLIAWFAPNSQTLAAKITPAKAILVFIAFVIGVGHMLQMGFNPFIYYRF